MLVARAVDPDQDAPMSGDSDLSHEVQDPGEDFSGVGPQTQFVRNEHGCVLHGLARHGVARKD